MVETLFSQLTHWHWIILALVLLGAEMIGAGGMLLGAMVASALMGIAVSFINISWQYQLIFFAVGSVVFSFSYWRFFKKFNQSSDRPELNNRAAQLVGHRMSLAEDIDFQGRLQIGDTFWKVKSEQPLKSGEHVEVTSADVDTLHLSKL